METWQKSVEPRITIHNICRSCYTVGERNYCFELLSVIRLRQVRDTKLLPNKIIAYYRSYN